MTLIQDGIAHRVSSSAWSKIMRELHVHEHDLRELKYLHAVTANVGDQFILNSQSGHTHHFLDLMISLVMVVFLLQNGILKTSIWTTWSISTQSWTNACLHYLVISSNGIIASNYLNI